MVKVIQFFVHLTTLSLLWLAVKAVQFLLKLANRIQDADSTGWAEIRLQCDIRQMVEDAARKAWDQERGWA